MDSSPLIWPMAAHVALTALLYALLTAARAPSVWGVGHASWADAEQRIGANLRNQFEWPLFFHVACLLLMQRYPGAAPDAQLALAWVFVAGRVAHSAVHVATTNVRLRGIVFTINFRSRRVERRSI